MNKYQKGRRAEYKTKATLEKLGYLVMRTAGSHSPFDLIAFAHPADFDLPQIRAIQVKSSRYLNKKDVKELRKMKLPSSVMKELWHYKPRKEVRIIVCNESQSSVSASLDCPSPASWQSTTKSRPLIQTKITSKS